MTQETLTQRDSILLLPQVETLLGVTRKTLLLYVGEGRIPQPRRLGKAVYWVREELERALTDAPRDERWPVKSSVQGVEAA